MLRDEVISYLGESWEATCAYISKALSTDIPLLQAVNDSLLSHSGKMLRPIVSLLVADLINGGVVPDDALRFAAAAELLHNATLLHDDVADESDTRRGEPTLRSKLGPAAAVLVGDFWLSRAVTLVVDSDHCNDVVKIFSKTLTDLAEGEMLQMEKAQDADTDEQDYFRIIYCKTASLFVVSAEAAAIATDATQEQLKAAIDYASALGTAFQIKDDILDYDGDGSLGKPVGIDLLEQKITLPLLCAMKDSPQEAQIRKMVKDIPQHPQYCEQIRKFVDGQDGVRKASLVLEEYVNKALAALEIFPQSRAKEYLSLLARYNSIRTI